MKLATADFSWPLLLGLFAGRSHIRPEMVRHDIPMWSGVLKERLARANLELADFFVQAATDFESLAINNPADDARQQANELFVDLLRDGPAAGCARDDITAGRAVPGR